LEIHYHPGKDNVIADALSKKAQCHCTTAQPNIKTLCQYLEELNLEIVEQGTVGEKTPPSSREREGTTQESENAHHEGGERVPI
jgi:hypothetical protein